MDEYDCLDDTDRREEIEACRDECVAGWRAFAATDVLEAAAAADHDCAWFAYARSNLALLTLTLVCEDCTDLTVATVAIVRIEESDDRRDALGWRMSGVKGGVAVLPAAAALPLLLMLLLLVAG